MPTPLLQPALVFNFNVIMWDVQSPDVGSRRRVAVARRRVSSSSARSRRSRASRAAIEIETYQEGGRNDRLHKFIKTAKFPNLVF